MKGRKPLPENVKLLRGTGGKKAKDGVEIGSARLLYAPKDLTFEAKRAWPQFAKPLAEAGITTALDAAALRLLVETYSTWLKANEAIQREGMTYEANGIQRVSPWIRIQASSGELMLRLLSEFGMTP
ncbi:MAG: phage terminase small subunit P27 family, partial [Gammaproteobacteria bacterium]